MCVFFIFNSLAYLFWKARTHTSALGIVNIQANFWLCMFVYEYWTLTHNTPTSVTYLIEGDKQSKYILHGQTKFTWNILVLLFFFFGSLAVACPWNDCMCVMAMCTGLTVKNPCFVYFRMSNRNCSILLFPANDAFLKGQTKGIMHTHIHTYDKSCCPNSNNTYIERHTNYTYTLTTTTFLKCMRAEVCLAY